MSWGVNLGELAAARDALRDEVAEHARSHPLEQLANAHRWLGEEDDSRRRYREAAAAAEAELARWDREDTSAIGRIGSLLLRAGDETAAAPWLDRAARSERRPERLAPLSYLRGDVAGAAEHARAVLVEEPPPYPWMEGMSALARARRDGDAGAAGEAIGRFATAIREERAAPDQESGSGDLSLFGWLEEAFRVRASLAGEAPPDHPAMLDAAGLLRAEPGPPRPEPAPDAGPQSPGTRTIAYPRPGGGWELEPSVTVDERGDLHFLLHPERGLRVAILQDEAGRWRARLGDEDLPGTYRGPRSAKRALTDLLRDEPDGQWAIALLGSLFREAFRLDDER